MSRRVKGYTVHEVIALLEAEPDFTEANIYITPPTNPDNSDEDSGDEELMTVDNLSSRQLEAEAEATVFHGCVSRERICVDEASDYENDQNAAAIDDSPNDIDADVTPDSAATAVATADVGRTRKRLSVRGRTGSPSTTTEGVRNKQRKLPAPVLQSTENINPQVPQATSEEEANCHQPQEKPVTRKRPDDKRTRTWVKKDISTPVTAPDNPNRTLIFHLRTYLNNFSMMKHLTS